ncbi:four helix bundle protein [Flavobacterium sp. ARAG 55.4]|uniref:four helix bundle protein n=1 Tax=Flavobacterium sp. ARAG 55.4 TaxID=3451357 RepID=UPI003F47BA90
MKDHKGLDVWKQSMLLAEDVYALTKEFPSEEKYGLSSQIKRAVVSIPAILLKEPEEKVIKNLYNFYILRWVFIRTGNTIDFI